MGKRKPKWQPPFPDPNKGRNRNPQRPRLSITAFLCNWGGCVELRLLEDVPLCEAHLRAAHKAWSIEHSARIKEKVQARIDAAAAEVEVIPDPVPEPEPAPVPVGTIYFARSGGFIKIGWTSDLAKRMKAYPPDTQLLAIKPGTRKDERALHRKFAHLLTYGREWFPLAPQITEYIDIVKREHGEPPVVDFAAKRAERIVGPRLNRYVGGEHRGPGPKRRLG